MRMAYGVIQKRDGEFTGRGEPVSEVTHVVIKLRLRFAAEIWIRVVAIDQTLNLILYTKDAEDPLCMLMRPMSSAL